MRQPRKLSISAFPGRDRPQVNKAVILEVANCLNTIEISLI